MDVKNAQTETMPGLQEVRDLGSEDNESKGGREMPDRAYKTPVKDLLAAIPHDLVIQWQDKDGLASHNCPIGRLAREAIAAIEAKPEPKCKTCDDTKVVGNGTSTIPCACKVFGHKDCLLCKSTSSYRQTEITDCPDCKEPAKHAQEKT